MVIGLDIDGTISRAPKFFAFLSQSALMAGHDVIVITFRQDRENAVSDLSHWDIAYSRLVTWSAENCAAEEMMEWKGRVCEELGVELLFEDDPQVLCRVDPAIVSMMVVNHEEYELARLSG